MLGRQYDCSNAPISTGSDKDHQDRYKRDIFTDMKIAIDCLKEFNEKLNTLHPDVLHKIKNLL